MTCQKNGIKDSELRQLIYMLGVYSFRQYHKVGLPGIGYGDRSVSTEVPKGTTAILLRHTFELKEEFKSESLYLLIDYD